MGYTIPRAYIDNLVDAMEAISAANKKALKEALASIDLSDPKAEDTIVYAMQIVCNGGTKQAAYLARHFYLGLRDIMVGNDDGYEGVEETGYVPGATETATRGIVRSNDSEAALAALQSRVGYEVKRASGGTVYACGRSDPRPPRFARIPRRSKSYAAGCPFCQMLASRGFVYLSEMSAGGIDPNHYHDDCHCQVVPSWEESPRVEDYDRHDYDEGYQRYLDQDHSKHEAKLKVTRKNRYKNGRLKAGYSGLRVDQQKPMTSADRAAQHAKNVAAQHAGWKAAYEKKHQQQ